MAEWPKAAVLKTVGRLRAPWVRILLLRHYLFVISYGYVILSCTNCVQLSVSNKFRLDVFYFHTGVSFNSGSHRNLFELVPKIDFGQMRMKNLVILP